MTFEYISTIFETYNYSQFYFKVFMKGIIAAGGKGTRLYPLTLNISKHLLPVYNKPLIYYPLTNLIASGINEICIVSNSLNTKKYKDHFGSGEKFGCKFKYAVQEKSLGIPDVISKGYEVFGETPITLILGDNIITASDNLIDILRKKKINGSQIFTTKVSDPSRFGIINYDKSMNILSLEEKPKFAKSNYAIIGLYIFDQNVYQYLKNIKISKRGEYEIIDIINQYKNNHSLKVNILKRGSVWFDAGTYDSMNRASNYIELSEKQSGVMIGCIEEAAFQSGFINKENLFEITKSMPESGYKNYLLDFQKYL